MPPRPLAGRLEGRGGGNCIVDRRQHLEVKIFQRKPVVVATEKRIFSWSSRPAEFLVVRDSFLSFFCSCCCYGCMPLYTTIVTPTSHPIDSYRAF